MKKSKVQNVIANPTFMILFVIGILLLSLVFSRIFKSKESGKAQIKQGQIQIVKGDEVITINQNGLVEYKSKDRSYSETWDASQINSFFSMMERKARDYLTKRVSGGDCAYKVFMFLDRKLVTICIDSGDKDVAETVEPIFIKYSDVNLSDYFGNGEDEDGDNSDDEFSGTIEFPTPTSGLSQSTPTPSPSAASNGNTNYAPVKAGCENWSASIVNNKAIISNTYCTVDSTPTPSL
jgi:hypothetical protein